MNVATFTWQGLGRRATTTNQNGTVTDYTYDGFRRVSEIDHLTPTKTFHKFEYAYDKVHNRRMEKNSFDSTWVATLESINARIQRVKKMACGFRNMDRFKTAIYFHLGGLDMRPEVLLAHSKS